MSTASDLGANVFMLNVIAQTGSHLLYVVSRLRMVGGGIWWWATAYNRYDKFALLLLHWCVFMVYALQLRRNEMLIF